MAKKKRASARPAKRNRGVRIFLVILGVTAMLAAAALSILECCTSYKPSNGFKKEGLVSEQQTEHTETNRKAERSVSANFAHVSAFSDESNIVCSHVKSSERFYSNYGSHKNIEFTRSAASNSVTVNLSGKQTNESIINLESNNVVKYEGTYTETGQSLDGWYEYEETVYYYQVCCHNFRTRIEGAGFEFGDLNLSKVYYTDYSKVDFTSYNSEEDYLIFIYMVVSSKDYLTDGISLQCELVESFCDHVNHDSNFSETYTITNELGSIFNQEGNTTFTSFSRSSYLTVKLTNAITSENIISLEKNNVVRYKATCKKYIKSGSSTRETTYTAYYIEICIHNFRARIEAAGTTFSNVDLTSLKFESANWQKNPMYTYNSEEDYFLYKIYTTSAKEPLTSGGYSFDVEVSNLPPDPVKEGYTFTGWYTDEACTIPFTGTVVTEDITLYAGWRINTYTLTLNGNGGELTEISVTGEYNTVPTIPEPVRTGYIFTGWKVDGKTYDIGKPLTQNLTLVAQWQATICTLTLNANGGELATSTVSGEYNTVPTIPMPSRAHYTFTGWKTASGEAYDVSMPLRGNLTITAQWQINTYTLTLDGNGGELAASTVSGEYNTVPAIPNPKRTGYTFTGWKTASGEAYDVSTALTGNLTITAQWQINTYTLTLNGNGGEISESTVSGEYNTIPTIPTPTRTGYNFTGWKTEIGEEYGATSPITENLTLIAQWEIKKFKVTFIVDGVIYREKFFEYGTKISVITKSAEPELFAQYAVDGAGESLAGDYAIEGDVTVHAEKGTTAQKITGNWKSIVVCGVCGIVVLTVVCCIPAMVRKRK